MLDKWEVCIQKMQFTPFLIAHQIFGMIFQVCNVWETGCPSAAYPKGIPFRDHVTALKCQFVFFFPLYSRF